MSEQSSKRGRRGQKRAVARRKEQRQNSEEIWTGLRDDLDLEARSREYIEPDRYEAPPPQERNGRIKSRPYGTKQSATNGRLSRKSATSHKPGTPREIKTTETKTSTGDQSKNGKASNGNYLSPNGLKRSLGQWMSDPETHLRQIKDAAKMFNRGMFRKRPDVKQAFSNACDRIIKELGNAPELQSHLQAHWKIGTTLSYLGRNRDALPYVERTIALAPESSRVRNNAQHKLGMIHSALGM